MSGGDTLIAVRVPPDTTTDQLTVTREREGCRRPASVEMRRPENIRGVDRWPHRRRESRGREDQAPRHEASLTITNHPITGPILSGPHLTRYECSTEASGLGPALDANCSAPRKSWHFYRSTDNTFKPLPNGVSARPADIATTTTTDGKTVPYIVRVDSGTINRAIYQIAMLDDPGDGIAKSWCRSAAAPGRNTSRA